MTPSTPRSIALGLLLGGALTLLVNQWVATVRTPVPFWLASGAGIARMVVVLVIGGLLAKLVPRISWTSLVALAVGSSLGSLIVLVAGGPGNLWPLAVAMTGLLTVGGFGMGVALAVVMRWAMT